MGFAAWFLNVDSQIVVPGVPSVAAVPGVRILGTIIQFGTTPALRHLDDIRLRNRRLKRKSFFLSRIMNPNQFAYILNKELGFPRKKRLNPLSLSNLKIASKEKKSPIILFDYVKEVDEKLSLTTGLKPIKSSKVLKKEELFDFEEFLVYKPNMKKKHYFLR